MFALADKHVLVWVLVANNCIQLIPNIKYTNTDKIENKYCAVFYPNPKVNELKVQRWMVNEANLFI